MINKTREYIICAAIWYDDGISRDDEQAMVDAGETRTFPAHFRGATFQNTNITTGYVICGWRHGNIIAVKPCNPSWCPEIKDTVQGFMTSKGRFVDRWQAAYIAWRAEQILTNFPYSKNFLKEGTVYKIINGEVDYLRAPGEETNFDIEAFMDSKPTDNRFHDNNPFEMMYSEDFY